MANKLNKLDKLNPIGQLIFSVAFAQGILFLGALNILLFKFVLG
jgi:hypothetical protein